MRELRRHQRESPSPPLCLSQSVVHHYPLPDAHMLRHARGYKLANDGHDARAIQAYLGHRNIQNATRYTALAPERFREFFRN